MHFNSFAREKASSVCYFLYRSFAEAKMKLKILKETDMQKNIVNKVMMSHPKLNEFVDGSEIAKQVHSLYKILGGIKNPSAAKGFLRYVTNENEYGWDYVVQFLFYFIEQIDNKGLAICKDNIDWEVACKKSYPKILALTKTKTAFKDLFFLIALNNGDDTNVLLADATLAAYGWEKIVKKIVATYEEWLCTSTEIAEYTLLNDIMQKEEVLEGSVVETKENTSAAYEEVSEEDKKCKTETVPQKKYARGRTIVLSCLSDGTEEEYPNPMAIESSIGIPMGNVRKNVSGHSDFIRFNNKKYKASYKMAS